MSLHSGIDTVAFVTMGWYSETYGAGDKDNIADLFCSYGLIEDIISPSSMGLIGMNLMLLLYL